MMSGLYSPDASTITVGGREVRFASTRGASAAGIATVYQELLLFPELMRGGERLPRQLSRRPERIDWSELRAHARQQRPARHLRPRCRRQVLTLSVARQRVEIAKGAFQERAYLIMGRADRLAGGGIGRAAPDGGGIAASCANGVGIVYVSHRMSRSSRTGRPRHRAARRWLSAPATSARSTKLLSFHDGRPADRQPVPQADRHQRHRAGVKGLNHGRHVQDISFVLRLVNLGVAAGRQRAHGTRAHPVRHDAGHRRDRARGRTVAITSPRQAPRPRIAYVPEDRGQQGLVPKQMAIRKNVSMASIERFSSGIFLQGGTEAQRALDAVKRLRNCVARDIGQPVGELSGRQPAERW